MIPTNLQDYLDEVEREILQSALYATGGNRTAAGRAMGLTLRQMRYRMTRLNVTARWPPVSQSGTAIVVDGFRPESDGITPS